MRCERDHSRSRWAESESPISTPAGKYSRQRSLTRRGFRTDSTSSPDEALHKAGETPYDGAILDLVMPGMDGADLAGLIRQKIPGLPVALLTGYTHSPLLSDVERTGIAVFTKPVAVQDLVDFLQAQIG